MIGFSRYHQHAAGCYKAWLLIILLLSLMASGRAQNYPVHVTTILSPPHSLYLADYASPESNGLQVILNLLELDRTDLRVKLRLEIAGAGITLRTSPAYLPPPIILQGGVPEVLSGFDLRNYLNPDNLDFAGISKAAFLKGGKLPEGFYTLSIQVLEYNRSVVISNPGMANAWIILNDPPLINAPFDGEKIIATDPQNIFFSWTPRHTASPNAAFSTKYDFTLVEMYPGQTDPEAAIRASNSIFHTQTANTSLNYGIMEPTLTPGKQYAFRVQAFDTQGRDLFKNDGYSETHAFQFGERCLPPEKITAKPLDAQRINVAWEGLQQHTAYTVAYRKKGNNRWNEEETLTSSMTIPQLENGHTYEYRVKGHCNSLRGDFSVIKTVETPLEAEAPYVCGAEAPPIDLNPNPLLKPLIPLDVIHTADWDITLVSVSSNDDGSYSGTGHAPVPFFSMAAVRVTFDRIFVNEDYRVIDGYIKTVYSDNSRSVWRQDANSDVLDEAETGTDPGQPAGAFTDEQLTTHYEIVDKVTLDEEIETITQNEDGTVTLTTADGDEQVVTPDEIGDLLITDASGDQWVVGSDGSLSNPADLDAAGEQQTLQADYIVNFKPADLPDSYGYDAYDPDIPQWKSQYPNALSLNDAPYVPSWKSVASGYTDQLLAYTSSDTFPENIRFGTPAGAISASAGTDPGTKALNITGKSHEETETLDAFVSTGDEGDTPDTQTIGRINIVSYDKITQNLVLVPVNNAPTPGPLEIGQINQIFRQAVAEWNVTVSAPFSYDVQELENFDSGTSGMLSSFPPKMRALNKAFKKSEAVDYDPNAYYIFLIADATLENASMAGFMPFKRQFGYVFTPNTASLGQTIAHELAHGAFRLKHTFSSEYGVPQGSTDNLMDYSGPQATHLKKFQWDFVHDPESMVGWFEDDEESAYTDIALFVDYLGHRDVFVHDDMFTGNDVVLLSPAGKPIQLPKTIVPSFTGSVKDQDGTAYDLGIPRGVLLAFQDGDKVYTSNFSQVDGQYVFNGYKLKGSNPVSYKETQAPARTESMVVIGAEDEYCFLGIHSGYYSHSNNSPTTGYLASGPVMTGAISLRDKETQGWIRIDQGCTRDIELATLEPSYIDILKNGFVVVNPSDPNGVMFAYTKAVEGYQAGDATGYIYRTSDDQGNDIYFKWTGVVWERFELSRENQLDIPADILTLAEIWEAVKNDPVHSTLDLAGFVPVIGMAADGLNAVVYLVEGDQVAALLSSVAIISSGLVVGAKLGIRIIRNTRRIEAIFAIADDYAAGMEALLKRVESAYGVTKDWMRWQSNLLELAEKYGDDGMDVLLNLSRTMDNDVDFLKLADEINSLDNGAGFMANLSRNDFLEYIAEAGEGGVNAWRVLSDGGVDDLIKRNPEALEIIDKYRNTVDSDLGKLTDKFKNAANKEDALSDVITEVRRKARQSPGTSTGNGIVVEGKWMRGTEGNIGLFPKSVADKMKGKQFNNFDEFRTEFWKTVADDPDLASQFKPQNISRMQEGLAPGVKSTQTLGGRSSFEIHHKIPIHDGGGVYDIDNMVIVTPRYHKEILDPAYHFNK